MDQNVWQDKVSSSTVTRSTRDAEKGQYLCIRVIWIKKKMDTEIKSKHGCVYLLVWSKYKSVFEHGGISCCSLKRSCLDANNKKGNICWATLTHLGLLPSSLNTEQNTNQSLAWAGHTLKDASLIRVQKYRICRLVHLHMEK